MRMMQEQVTIAAAEETKVNRKPIAFLSYVNLDDQHDQGRLTQFRERLSGEVRMHTGEAFNIFQDRKDIAWGQQWQERLDTSLAATTFLLPIITPSFFKSEHCRAELARFIKREKELGRRDLILPVYYVNCPVLADKEKLQHDPLAQLIAARQYEDWRELRYEEFASPQVRKSLAKMAQQIVAALERSQKESSRAAAQSASQSNTFQSGGGTQSVAQGKPPPRSAIRSVNVITLCVLIGAAMLVSGYYSHQADVVAQAEPAEQPAPPAIVETVKQPEAVTAPKPAAEPKPSTVVAGAAAGAIAGQAIRRSNTTLLVGAVLGSIVDNEWDKYDQQQLNRAYEGTPSGQSTNWVSPDSRNQYQVTPQQAYVDPDDHTCRKAEVVAQQPNGNNKRGYVTACRDKYGTWSIVP
jgi:surface antigen